MDITKLQDLISIVMPFYNDELYIEEAISTLLAQSYKNFELICVDDASSDNSLGIVEAFASQDNRIRILKLEQNVGGGPARNQGMKIAKGKYIAAADADDIYEPERLALQYAYLENHPNIFLVGGGCNIVDEDSQVTGVRICEPDEDILREKFKTTCDMMHPTIMFRNDGSVSYREKFVFAQDYDLYTRLLTDGKRIVNLPDILFGRRYNPSAASFSKRGIQKLFGKKVQEFYRQRVLHQADEYDKLDPQKLLATDMRYEKDSEAIQAQLQAYIGINNGPQVRYFALRYIRYGSQLKYKCFYALLFIASFFGLQRLKGLKSKLSRT